MKYECHICKDDGLCLNNSKNPDYDDDFFGSDLYDCADYYNQYIEGKPKGSWLIEWGKRLKEKEPYVSDFVKWSKRFTIIILFTLVSCDNIFEVIETDQEIESDPIYNFELIPRLPLDDNGFYHLELNRESNQTLHRISGSVSNSDGNPVELYWVEWESNLFWFYNGIEVPTTNKISYSNRWGEINNMIAPIITMVGDTMDLSYTTSNVYGSIKIVLD